MKLLFDHNLSYKLVAQLVGLFPDSSHVALLGLDQATDTVVWQMAREEGYTLVSKDSDFNDTLTAQGFPPKVIWIRLGNCTTAEIVDALHKNHAAILAFGQDDRASLLEGRTPE